MSKLHTLADVAADLQCSEWTVAELVRTNQVDCVRVSTTGNRGAIRFTDEQVAAIVEHLTVKNAVKPAPRKRRRRSA